MMKILIGFVLILSSQLANAAEWVEVDDASRILWQMTADGTVYFRNMNEFNTNMDGCCYTYYLVTTTDGGKSMWSTLLAKIAGSKRITLGFSVVGSATEKQALKYLGRHGHASNE